MLIGTDDDVVTVAAVDGDDEADTANDANDPEYADDPEHADNPEHADDPDVDVAWLGNFLNTERAVAMNMLGTWLRVVRSPDASSSPEKYGVMGR